MEDRFDAVTTAEQSLLFVRFERLVVLRDVHGETEIFFVAGRDGGGDGMAECPAQAERGFVRERGGLIPAFWLRMILFLVRGPYGFGHALQGQDAHLFLLCALEYLRAEVSLREEHPIDG